MKINNPTVYLDANFLVYWSVSKKPELRKRARLLFSQLRSQRSILAVSPLTFDEAWNGIRKEINARKACFEPVIFIQIENLTNNILSKAFIKIVQLQNPQKGILQALNNVKQFELRPRDGFHLAIMKDNEILKMVSSDPKFINQQSKMGIEVIPI